MVDVAMDTDMDIAAPTWMDEGPCKPPSLAAGWLVCAHRGPEDAESPAYGAKVLFSLQPGALYKSLASSSPYTH